MTTPTRRWARTDATQQRILDAATDVFSARGFSAATMADIVEHSGAQVAALDKHRGRRQQNVTVKYVHVAEGGQAIVGNVTGSRAAEIAKAETPPTLQAPSEMPLKVPPARQKVRGKR